MEITRTSAREKNSDTSLNCPSTASFHFASEEECFVGQQVYTPTHSLFFFPNFASMKRASEKCERSIKDKSFAKFKFFLFSSFFAINKTHNKLAVSLVGKSLTFHFRQWRFIPKIRFYCFLIKLQIKVSFKT